MLVVRSGSTRREALAQSAARLKHSRAQVIGAVLNAAPEGPGYYYWYRRYYSGQGMEPKRSPLSLTLAVGKRKGQSRKAG